MYLDQLSEVEKIAFSRLSYLLISYYGIDEHEQKLYCAALGEMGLTEGDVEGEIDVATEAAAFNTPASRRIALLELMLLALADGDVEDEEQNMLDVIIAQFGFDDETLEAAWSWVRGWYETFQAGRTFIGVPEMSAI